MNIIAMLNQSGAIGSLAQQLGVNDQVAQSGAEALLPSILGGFKKQAQAQPSGLAGIGGLLGGLGGGGLFDSVVSKDPTPVEEGNNILGQIFGSKDVSRTVAGQAAASTGLDPALLKKMLPILAMLVTGYMAKQNGGEKSAGGSVGGLLGGLLGGRKASGGGIASMLDMDGDGNPLDDILGMAGKFMR